MSLCNITPLDFVRCHPPYKLNRHSERKDKYTQCKDVYSTHVSSHISYGNCWRNIFKDQDVGRHLAIALVLKLVLTAVEIF